VNDDIFLRRISAKDIKNIAISQRYNINIGIRAMESPYNIHKEQNIYTENSSQSPLQYFLLLKCHTILISNTNVPSIRFELNPDYSHINLYGLFQKLLSLLPAVKIFWNTKVNAIIMLTIQCLVLTLVYPITNKRTYSL
jgi:hypothetical protein